MCKIESFGVRSPSNGRHSTVPLRRQPRASRRGVLLLVVLSMLVLFMLIGTAFLMSSGHEQTTAKKLARANRVGNPATKRLEGALLQVLRDTDNVYSVVRYHSLLRDMYGTSGFQGVVYSPDPTLAFDVTKPAQQVTRYSGSLAGSAQNQIGPTNGQFIDIYVVQSAYPSIDYSTQYDGVLYPMDLRNVLKLDRNAFGQPQVYPLPLTKDYFNGCVLTITSGPAAGQSTRILGYEYLGDLAASSGTNPVLTATRLFRFRVMNFQRADGQPLQLNADPSRAPELTDLGGEVRNQVRATQPATFLVNGRPFTGTGAGYNPLAVTGQPRLSALEFFPTSSTEAIGAELALLPNATYYNPLSAWNVTGTVPLPDAFKVPVPKTAISLLNNLTTPTFRYPTFAGPGDVNESYDAADFQNMFLALQTVTPRAQGRVWHSGFSTPFSVSDPEVWDGSKFANTDKFQRLDLEDLPLPSFHRPDLINYWYHRMLNSQWLSTVISDPDQRALAILQPYDANGNVNPAASGLTPQLAAMITAIKRQSSLRPLREDHPHFDGGNTQSVRSGLQATGLVDPATKTNIAIPYWEAVGPWDVDNDNDGIPDSVWVDLGDPVQDAEDGTRYKALYAFLIVDLDSRLNVNAHGLADDINPPKLALAYNLSGNPVQTNLAGNVSSNSLSKGLGYGPAEISLRPRFSIKRAASSGGRNGPNC
jgi:hypothetical protein